MESTMQQMYTKSCHDLLSLLLNLSKQTDREQIVREFIDTVTDIFPLGDVTYTSEPEPTAGCMFPIRTITGIYGFIVCAKKPEKMNLTDERLLETAVSMLAVVLEKIECDQYVSNQRLNTEHESKTASLPSMERDMEEKFREAAKVQSVGQLAGGIAHEFNNQLGGILGFANLLDERLKNDPTLQQYTDKIISAARRAADLTEKWMAFARKGAEQKMPVELNGLISEIVFLLEPTIKQRISIKLRLSKSDVTVMGAPSELQHAILNLVLNARDAVATKENGIIQLSTEVIRVDETDRVVESVSLNIGDYAVITVADNGIGMSEEVMKHAMEPFYTTRNDGKRTGLGLTATYSAVKHYHGDLVMHSTPENGTTIRLFLPIHQPCFQYEAEKQNATRKTAATTFQSPGTRVLLVDDDPLILEFTTEILTRQGYTVETCEDGADAVAHYKQQPDAVDVVVLDMMMPGMDGSQTIHLLKEINPQVRIVLASGYSQDALADELITENVAGFIQKPFNRQELTNLLDEILSR